MKYKHGFFQLSGKEDGLYLRIYPPLLGGNPVSMDDILYYLRQKKIEEYDVIELRKVVSQAKKPVEVKLNDKQGDLVENEYLQITISMDKKMAVGRFYPPSPKGKMMTREDIISDLEMAGVKHGIVKPMIDAYLKNRQYCVNIILAKGTAPREGHNASIEYHFDTTAESKPHINSDGSVDFHQLNNIVHVQKGDCLATLTPMDPGEPGIDVCGDQTQPSKVSNDTLKFGKNITLSEDGLRLYSDVSGHASLTDGRVFVSNVYEVPADVNSSTGDINYDGDVNISGNVITGFKVTATGNIYVKGAVEGAFLEAGGDIVLNRGIQGMERGVLKAGGNVVSKFIENSTVTAKGSVQADAIMHSNITAKEDIKVQGKRGLITGGTLHAGTMIAARVIGSPMGTHTSLEVGVDPTLVDEFHRLEKEVPELDKTVDKLDQTVQVLTKKLQKAGGKLSEEKMRQLKKANEDKQTYAEKLNEAEQRLATLTEEMEKHENGKISVESIAYPGVKVTISNVPYYVKTEIQHGSLVRDGADIRVKAF